MIILTANNFNSELISTANYDFPRMCKCINIKFSLALTLHLRFTMVFMWQHFVAVCLFVATSRGKMVFTIQMDPCLNP